MIIEIPFYVWTAIVSFLLLMILITLIRIDRRLKHFQNYDEKEGEPFKLHLNDFSKR